MALSQQDAERVLEKYDEARDMWDQAKNDFNFYVGRNQPLASDALERRLKWEKEMRDRRNELMRLLMI